MWVDWFSPSDSLSRITAHDASFETTELMPNFLKKPSSCAMTIGEQSVSAIIPKRMFEVSGESSAYAPPTHPPGRPFINVAAALAATVFFKNARRDVFVIVISSELHVEFEESKVDSVVSAIDRLCYQSAIRVSEVPSDAEMRCERHVRADVIERRECALSVRRPAGVAERRGLKRGAARVPEVVRISEPQCMDVRAHRDALRTEDQLTEGSFGVHHVEERRARVNARRRKRLEERAVPAVGGVVVAGSEVVAGANPGLHRREQRGLPPGFGGICASTMRLRAPRYLLQRPPEHQIDSSGHRLHDLEDVAAVCADVDGVEIRVPDGGGPIVRFHDTASVVSVAEREHTPVGRRVLAVLPGHGAVEDIDL